MVLDVLWKRTDGPNWMGGDGWNVLNAEKCMFQGITCNNAGKVIHKANILADVLATLSFGIKNSK